MTELETNLIKIMAEATWLQDNYRISFEDHQQSLSDIIGWAKEALSIEKEEKGENNRNRNS